MRYDVIVVGAGPAGSTTARECSSKGLSVLLLDRAEFPRDKPCGGAVTVRAAEELPFDLDPVVERVMLGMYLSVNRTEGFYRRSKRELAYFTQRRNLDTFLVERATEAGASLRERAVVRDVETRESHTIVRTDDESFEARTLVAADGANGRTARLAGLDVAFVQGLALEGNVTPPDDCAGGWEDVMCLDVGGPPGGYGWMFPKGDHLNIGVGGFRQVGPNIRESLDQLVRFYGFDSSDLWGVRGHHLPLRRSNSSLVCGNVILVGDAAGLLDPLTGEGIYAAIWSGKAAARHIAAYLGGEVTDLDGYRREVERELIPELRVSRRFKDLFHLAPGFYIRVERWTSILWMLTGRILRGEQTYDDVMRRHSNLATMVDFVSDLVRVMPALQRIEGLEEPPPPQRFFLSGKRHQ